MRPVVNEVAPIVRIDLRLVDDLLFLLMRLLLLLLLAPSYSFLNSSFLSGMLFESSPVEDDGETTLLKEGRIGNF